MSLLSILIICALLCGALCVFFRNVLKVEAWLPLSMTISIVVATVWTVVSFASLFLSHWNWWAFLGLTTACTLWRMKDSKNVLQAIGAGGLAALMIMAIYVIFIMTWSTGIIAILGAVALAVGFGIWSAMSKK